MNGARALLRELATCLRLTPFACALLLSPLACTTSTQAAAPTTPVAARPAPAERWFTVADSPVPEGHILQPGRRCLKEVGCPFAPKELPACPDTLALTSSLREGDDVVISGTLSMTDKGRVTAAGCPEGTCCERHERFLQVRTPQGVVAVLFDEPQPTFTCKGDQSLICCGVPVDVPVVVKGKLGWNEALESHLVIKTPEICQLK